MKKDIKTNSAFICMTNFVHKQINNFFFNYAKSFYKETTEIIFDLIELKNRLRACWKLPYMGSEMKKRRITPIFCCPIMFLSCSQR